MEYLISAVLSGFRTFYEPQKSLTPVPIPAGLKLPLLGPAVDEPKSKRKRAAKEPGEQKVRSYKAKNEKEIRVILERLTGLKWASCRPSFLKGIAGRNLELDMYCPELNIAVEHQGQQHLGYVKFFHPNGYKDFEEQKERDGLKAALCRQNGVKLVCILCTEWDKLDPDPKVKDDFLLRKIGEVL
jgi:hypothetical protein